MLRKENNLQPNQSQWSLDSCDFTSRFVSSQKHKMFYELHSRNYNWNIHQELMLPEKVKHTVWVVYRRKCVPLHTHMPSSTWVHTYWFTWINWKQNQLDILYSFSQLAAQQYYQVFYMAFQYLIATLIHCTLNTRKVSIINYKFVSLKGVSLNRCMCVCTIHTYYDYQSENCTDVALRHCFVICDREKKS